MVATLFHRYYTLVGTFGGTYCHTAPFWGSQWAGEGLGWLLDTAPFGELVGWEGAWHHPF